MSIILASVCVVLVWAIAWRRGHHRGYDEGGRVAITWFDKRQVCGDGRLWLRLKSDMSQKCRGYIGEDEA